MFNKLEIRNMTRAEVNELVDWAAGEGWNPGLYDADLFWAADPEAFLAADLNGEMIGGGAITSYGGKFGFMGFFIIRPEFRGRGFGDRLWHVRRDRLIKRLQPNATIGLDGVFEMQERGMVEVPNPSEAFLAERMVNAPGSAPVRSHGGPGLTT